jgi:molybdate transport system substrate-binding protein
MRRRLVPAAAGAFPLPLPLALALVLAGCGAPIGGGTASSTSRAGSAAPSGTITVFAAASLKESFTTLGRQFERAHPGTTVVFSFGPSPGLATQITQGAPADVFAAASPTTMAQVTRAGVAASPTTFAANAMEIAVPAANPARVTRLSDLARPGVTVALCQSAVPCGSSATKVFANAGLRVTPVTEEVDVKAVLSKVTLGEVDAGVVYVTDLRAAGRKVRGVPIPDDVNASTSYPIATLTTSANKGTAQAFTAYVLSAAGTTVLARAGFTRP